MFEPQSASVWNLFLEFWSFSDPNAVWVLMGSTLLGISASVIGSFAFLRKRSLIGDVLAHAALPGVMTAFILFHANSPIVMFFGAMSSSLIGLWLMDWIPKNTKIKPDAAMAITLSFFFALGLMELSYIQGLAVEGKSGLDRLLFGQAAAMLPEDVYLLSIVATVVLLMVAVFFQKFRLIAFNRNYAKSLGLNLTFYEAMLALLIVMSVVIGLQIVGVVLMAAMLLTPIAAARFWSSQLTTMLLIAGVIGGLSAVFSSNISYVAPATPTGPWMVVVLSIIFIISFLFAPERGVVANLNKQRRLRRQVCEENILRTLYILNERHPSNAETAQISLDLKFDEAEILMARSIPVNELKRTLAHLATKGLILGGTAAGGAIQLTKQGAHMATSLTRRHRLWENYLTEKVAMSSENVHFQAEQMEHLLTEEQASELEKELGTVKDPHGKAIPKPGESGDLK